MKAGALLVQSRIVEGILNLERMIEARMIPQILTGGTAVLGSRNEPLSPVPLPEWNTSFCTEIIVSHDC